MTELTKRSLLSHAEALAKKEYSSRELTEAYLARIAEGEARVGAYLTVTAERALREAEESDKRRARGETLGVLDGIPCAVKDTICTAGVRTTCGSRMLEHYIPPYDATVIRRLSERGFVLLGKTNSDEFGMGSTTEYSALGMTRNPLDHTRVAGGSSGGSAAAVAAGECTYALGSDTGGSVRQPAAFCGIVGMKPTYGRVSRYGLVAFASSLEQIGPMSRTVGDNEAIWNGIRGADPLDATSREGAAGALSDRSDLRGLRIGLGEEFFGNGLSPDVKLAVLAAAERYRELGATVTSVSLPTVKQALAAYYVISAAEASSNLARFDGVRFGKRAKEYGSMEELYCRSRSEGFGAEVKRRILLGTFVLSEGYYDKYYKRALRTRERVRAEFDRVFEACDLLLTPVAPTVAYRLGEKMKNPEGMYLGDWDTVPVNLAGLPALSLPCGKGEGGLPVGMQLIGPADSEPLLYAVGRAFEEVEA